MKIYDDKRLMPVSVKMKNGKKDVKPLKNWQDMSNTWGKKDLKRADAIGLRTGYGMYVIDVDTKKIPKKYKKFIKSLGTPTVETARGYHYYVKSKFDMPNRSDIFNDNDFKVDIRGKGGFVFVQYNGNQKGISYKNIGKPLKDNRFKITGMLPDKVVVVSSTAAKTGNENSHSNVSKSEIKRALNNISSDISYEDWLRVGMALFSWNSNKGFKLFDKWSKKSDKYDGSTVKKWRDFERNFKGEVTVGTLFKMAFGEKENPADVFKYDDGELEIIKSDARSKKKLTRLEFDSDDFPKKIRDYCTTISKAKGVPFGSLLPSLFTSIAATVGDRCEINVGAWRSSLKVWGLLVGNSGVRKSAIMSDGMAGFNAIRLQDDKDHRHAINKWKGVIGDIETSLGHEQKAIQDLINKDGLPYDDPRVEARRKVREKIVDRLEEVKSNPPQGSVGMFEDVTDAALAKLLKEYEHGILGYYPEAGSLVNLINSKSGHTETLRQIMLKGYAGEGHTVHRSTLDDILLEKVNISLLGAIQPDVLKKMTSNSTADGFMGRFQFLYLLDKKEVSGAYEENDNEIDKKAVKSIKTLFEDFADGKFLSEYGISKRGLKLLREFEKKYLSEDIGGIWGEYLGKVSYSLNSLVLMFHLSDNMDEEEISDDTVRSAINVMKVFMNHAQIIYSEHEHTPSKSKAKATAGTSVNSKVSVKEQRISSLVGYIRKNIKKGMTEREIKLNSNLRRKFGSYAKSKEINKALKECGWKMTDKGAKKDV